MFAWRNKKAYLSSLIFHSSVLFSLGICLTYSRHPSAPAVETFDKHTRWILCVAFLRRIGFIKLEFYELLHQHWNGKDHWRWLALIELDFQIFLMPCHLIKSIWSFWGFWILWMRRKFTESPLGRMLLHSFQWTQISWMLTSSCSMCMESCLQ